MGRSAREAQISQHIQIQKNYKLLLIKYKEIPAAQKIKGFILLKYDGNPKNCSKVWNENPALEIPGIYDTLKTYLPYTYGTTILSKYWEIWGKK